MKPGALEWIGRFRRHLTTERRLSAHTDVGYAADLEALVAFCDRDHLADWSSIDGQHVRLFAAHSHKSTFGPRSVQRRLSAWRSFFDFLTERGVLKANPARDIRAPKAARRLPGTLDPDQMARLLEVHVKEPLDARDHALMELLYSSGLRLAETVGLDVTDVDLRDRTVRVVGKGRKERIVPVGRHALAALERWLRERAGLVKADEAALFVGRNGRRIGPRAVQKRLAQWGLRQGLGVNVYPHLFRHSFATHLLESSGELRGVQELLGHADISSTGIYTHLDFQHLARTYEAAHPRARRKRSP